MSRSRFRVILPAKRLWTSRGMMGFRNALLVMSFFFRTDLLNPFHFHFFYSRGALSFKTDLRTMDSFFPKLFQQCVHVLLRLLLPLPRHNHLLRGLKVTLQYCVTDIIIIVNIIVTDPGCVKQWPVIIICMIQHQPYNRLVTFSSSDSYSPVIIICSVV